MDALQPFLGAARAEGVLHHHAHEGHQQRGAARLHASFNKETFCSAAILLARWVAKVGLAPATRHPGYRHSACAILLVGASWYMHMHMHMHMQHAHARAHAHAVYRCMRVLCARMCTIDTCSTTLYYPTRLNEVQTWLLDEDACKTEWQTLLDMRAHHAQ